MPRIWVVHPQEAQKNISSMDLEGDLGAVVRATRKGCARIDELDFDSCNLLNAGAVLEPKKEVTVPISISISDTVTYSPFYGCNPSRSNKSLLPSMFENLDHYYHNVEQKPAWCCGTAPDSSLGKAEKKDAAHDLIMAATTSTITTSNNQEQASGRINVGGVCPRQSLSPVHVKSPPRSPTRQDDPSAKTPDKVEADCSSSSPIKTESTAERIVSNRATASGTRGGRRNQQRRTVSIAATEGSWNKPGGGGVASDLWAWRKYGQKPIKGSPYPRGYYRCSSCKGCPARKQVERSHTDPTKLVITYTAEHNHAWPTSNPRNGLALTGSLSSTQKDMMALVVPHSPQKSDVLPDARGSNPAASPTTAKIEQEKPRSPPATDCLDFNLTEETTDCLVEDHNQTAGLHMISSNHVNYDDLFAGLGELKDFARYFSDYKSDEETDSTVVDPYNLFNLSSASSNKTTAD